MDEASRFRRAAAAANQGRPRAGWRYPPELRAKAVELFASRREPVNALAASLGVGTLTLTRWLESAGNESLAAFREIEVVDAGEVSEAGTRLRVRSPNGWQVEGLSFREVVELMRLSG